jgi:DNA adenine methylase/adenine-specific DNA-methyltransferase
VDGGNTAEHWEARAEAYPEFRYMGSKHRLLPWLHGVLGQLPFDTAADPFSGSGCVSYMLKTVGKQVRASDFLNFPSVIAEALVANAAETLAADDVALLTSPAPAAPDFVRRTFAGIFFTPEDLRFLDEASHHLARLQGGARALALTALLRACMKRQPRGVFTVANGPGGAEPYDDGRRDVRTPLRQHFVEQAALLNPLVFDNGRANLALREDVFAPDGAAPPDLAYLDPPYVPRADDNCYVKRYHFLEGLSTYWRGARILEGSKVKKLAKPHTPFGYRREAPDAFDRLFRRFRDSIIVLSYSDNAFPDRPVLIDLLRRYKRRVEVHERPHRYHFGTHRAVTRAQTTEYLLVGHDG